VSQKKVKGGTMALYVYGCKDQECNTKFDKIRPMSDRDEPINCPKCGTAIDVQDILAHQLEEEIAKKFQSQLAEEKKKFEEEKIKTDSEKIKILR